MTVKLLLGGIGIIALVILFQIGWLMYFIQIGKGVVARSTPFSRENPDADFRILIIGDSTAVGIGAEDPNLSVAGRYGQAFPDAEIINRGENGKKTGQLIEEFKQLQEEKFDLVEVHTGGNDVIRFKNLDEVEKDFATVLDLAQNIGDEVIVITSGNLGTVKLFPPGTRKILEARSRRTREIFIAETSKREKVHYIDLFREADEDPFAKDPERFYSPDFLHPNGEGYADWWYYISLTLNDIGLLEN